jgi:hypothetical protein
LSLRRKARESSILRASRIYPIWTERQTTIRRWQRHVAGMSNVPGEWAAFYHGTKRDSVAAITQTPLRPGPNNAYGQGVYCTPNITVASGYAHTVSVQTSAGPKTYQYVFMCRANPGSICNCTTSPCPNASNPAYTLHKTSCTDYWFVNGTDNNHQNIRPYGLLVRES